MAHRDTTSSEDNLRVSCLSELFALFSTPVALLNASGRIEFFSESFALRVGLAPGSLHGVAFQTLLEADQVPLLRDLMAVRTDFADHAPRQSLKLNVDALGTSAAHVTPLDVTGNLPWYIVEIPGAADEEDPRLRYVMERFDLGVWDYDTQKDYFTVSDAWRQIRGIPKGTEINVSGDAWLDEIHEEDRDTLRELLKGQIAGTNKNTVIQYRRRHTAGHWVWILCRASVMGVDADGTPLKIVGTDTDITEMKEREGELLELTSKFQLAIEASGMGIWEFDPATSQVQWDDKMLEIYDITDGKNIRPDDAWETYIHPDDLSATLAYSDECQRNNRDFKRDYRIVRPNGRVRHIRSLARNVVAQNSGSKLIGVNIDISEDYFRAQELERARRQLEHDSKHDALTHLGNRRKSDEETHALFARITNDHEYAVMHIDLDHFKRVNDTLGHAAGDHVLSVVARKLRDIISNKGSVFRIGGDEFTILFEEAPTTEALADLCQSLIRTLSQTETFQGQDCTIGASIGYAIGKGPPLNPTDVFMQADTALYAAKRAGRSCFRAYSAELEAEAGNVDTIRQDLIDALKNQEFICHFQPQFDAQSLEIVGAEALVRWHCPKRGLLTPDKFLPQIIQSELLPEMDSYVFDYVVAKQSEWVAAGLSIPRVSLNISKERLGADGLLDQVRDRLKPHHTLTFELLETAFIDRMDTHLAFTLDTLKEFGIRIELDDFGSGNSSVVALQTVQPDSVKIDRSLVKPLDTRPSQLMTLRALSRIARLENADVVVEGLETGLQLATIRDLDCDALQGYALQRPMPESDFIALIRRSSGAGESRVQFS